MGASAAMQGCLSDEVLRIPGPFQSSTLLRIVRSIRPCQANADIICFQEVSPLSMVCIAFLQRQAMPSWTVVGDFEKHTDMAIAYNTDAVTVKHGSILSIKLYDMDNCHRKWRRYLQAALPLPALLSPSPTYRSPPRVYHYLAIG